MSGQENDSATAVLASADANTVQSLIELGGSRSFSITDVNINYVSEATANTVLTLYDEDSATAVGDLSDSIDQYVLTPGDKVELTDISRRAVTEELVAHPDASQDGDIYITVGGEPIAL